MPPKPIPSECPVCHEVRLVRPYRVGSRCQRCWCREMNAVRYPKDRIYAKYHPLGAVRDAMIQRCENPNNKWFYRYGARGIFVCPEWRKSVYAFIRWALWHGYEKGLQIDRRDNDGPYSPENCRWVTPRVNSNNKSR